MACDLFDEIAAAAGLTAVKESRTSRGELTARVFELDADTEVETHDHGMMTVAELERLMRARGRRRRRRRCAARAVFTTGRGCGPILISSTGAATASASTTR